MSSDQDFLEVLQKEFLDEVTFLLEQCEESYLNLDQPEHREEELGKIFRMAHSMKGAGAAVGFTDLSSFAHIVEDALSLLRTHPDLIDNDIISLLLRSGDELKLRVQMLKANDKSPWSPEDLREEIKTLVRNLQEASGMQVSATTPTPNSKEAPPDIDDLLKQIEAEEKAKVEESSEAVVGATLVEGESSVQAINTNTLDKKSADAFLDSFHKEGREAQVIPIASAATKATSKGGSAELPKAANRSEASLLKIDAERIDQVLNIVGELVVVKSQLINQSAVYHSDARLGSIVSLIDKTIRELQDRTLSLRMTPLKTLFMKTQRVIRDLSLKLNKTIELKTSGEDIEIDRTMVDLLADPLLHMARNSLDHGIEKGDVRLARGKDAKGKILLTAAQMGGRVVIQIEDDGGGINKAKVLKKAIEKGLYPADTKVDQVPEKDIFALLFAPGFSTADQVTDVSGRGVGMDVVNSNIEKLRGTIEIDSVEEKGATVTISIPLTTSITDGLIVNVGNTTFIMPMDSIVELVDQPDQDVIQMMDGRNVFRHRERVLPLIKLTDFSMRNLGGFEESESKSNLLMLVEAGNKKVAIQVDGVVGQTQVVLKSLSDNFKNLKGIAGAAILGDGKIALILDPIGLVEYFKEQAA